MAGEQLTADLGLCWLLRFPEGKRTGHGQCRCAGARVCSPGQHHDVGAGEGRPKLGHDCGTAVCAVAPRAKRLLTNQRREGIRAVLYERQP